LNIINSDISSFTWNKQVTVHQVSFHTIIPTLNDKGSTFY